MGTVLVTGMTEVVIFRWTVQNCTSVHAGRIHVGYTVTIAVRDMN